MKGDAQYLHGKDPAATPGPDGSYPLLCHLLDTAAVVQRLWSVRVRPNLRSRISHILGVDEVTSCKILMLLAAVHDLGKANPFFQYQERQHAEFASGLHSHLEMPATPPLIRGILRANAIHPLRRHEYLSHRILTGRWADSHDAIRSSDWLAILAGGHHGYWRQPQPEIASLGEEVIHGWTDAQQELLTRVQEILGTRADELPELKGSAAAVPFACFSGLLTLADWLASDNGVVAAGKRSWLDQEQSGLEPTRNVETGRAWLELRTPDLHAHTDQSLGPVDFLDSGSHEVAILGSFQPRPLQQEAMETSAREAGLWIAMYPTGDGKSEAALLRGAGNTSEGFFFGLPTLATTDAMESRLTRIASRLPTGVMPLLKSHQYAGLIRSDDVPRTHDRSDDEACDHSNPTWYTASIRKLLSPNVVATVDQAMSAALACRHITLRMLAMANHHVILDEVHTYDEYQTQLLIELLYWWGATHTRVTLLSATLATTHLSRMVQAYRCGQLGTKMPAALEPSAIVRPHFPSTITVPMDPDQPISERLPTSGLRLPPDTSFDVIEVKGTRADRIADHIAWATSIAAKNPNSPIAIVCNVVSDCQQIATALADSAAAESHEVVCVHSCLIAPHRLASEARVLARAGRHARLDGSASVRPLLVVGTQVIQASLDYDVDFMSTDMAPAPDLLQRLGRVWRFDGDPLLPSRFDQLGQERRLRIVSVVDEHGIPTRSGSAPYLNAVIRRTHDFAKAHLHQVAQPILDLSQAWVDAAYDKDPWALISDDVGEMTAATEEEVAELRRREAAEASRAVIAQRGGRTSLFSASTTRRGPQTRWADLVQLSAKPDVEELMATRFVESESLVVVAFSSEGETSSQFTVADELYEIGPLKVGDLLSLAPRAAAEVLRTHRLAVPAHLTAEVRVAIDQTLDGREWSPTSSMLRGVWPLKLSELPNTVSYHPVVGLQKRES